MKTITSLIFFACILFFPQAGLAAPVTYKIVTGGATGTYIQIGKNLAKYVAPNAGINLQVMESAGSLENVRRMRHEKHVKLAIVQHDVFQRYKKFADEGNVEAQTLINKLRVVLPLYNEEVHFLVRANSEINYFHEIENKNINLGPEKSGTAMTAELIYLLMFGHAISKKQVSNFKIPDAMWKMAKTREVDVVAYVAGQPTSLFANLPKESSKHYKFLSVDRNHRSFGRLQQNYYRSLIKQTSYPRIAMKDVPTLAVKAYLITFNYQKEARQELAAFAGAICRNFSTLQQLGHSKWKEVSLDLSPLPGGWSYYSATQKALASCGRPCDNLARDLGLCK